MENELLCRGLACLNINVDILILLKVRGNHSPDLCQCSTSKFKALKRHALKNTRQFVGNYVTVHSVVLDTKFRRDPPAKPTSFFNHLEKPTEGQGIAKYFKHTMLNINSTFLTTK